MSYFVEISDDGRRRGFTCEIGCYEKVFAVTQDDTLRRPRQLIATIENKRVYKFDCQVFEDIEDEIHMAPEENFLQGTYVFGGFVSVHFGHFLVECIAPLWGIDHIFEKLDGIVYFPYHDPNKITDGAREKLHSIALTMLEGLGVDLPVKFIHQPTMIEKLFVPENGMGFEKKFSGSTPFANYFRKRNAWARSCLKEHPNASMNAAISVGVKTQEAPVGALVHCNR